jgi:hypothetical protein
VRSVLNGEIAWEKDRLSVYVLSGSANKVYLDALWARHAVL